MNFAVIGGQLQSTTGLKIGFCKRPPGLVFIGAYSESVSGKARS